MSTFQLRSLLSWVLSMHTRISLSQSQWHSDSNTSSSHHHHIPTACQMRIWAVEEMFQLGSIIKSWESLCLRIFEEANKDKNKENNDTDGQKIVKRNWIGQEKMANVFIIFIIRIALEIILNVQWDFPSSLSNVTKVCSSRKYNTENKIAEFVIVWVFSAKTWKV